MALEILELIPNSLTNSVVLSSFVFLVLTWLMVYRTAFSIKLKNKHLFSFITALILLGWFSLVFFLGKIGFFARNDLVAPYIFISFILLFGILQKVYYSDIIKFIGNAIPVHWIVGIQIYRIVGYGFIVLYFQGLLPAAFAFSSGIGDMIVGFSAPFVAYLYYLKKTYSKKLVIIWNIIGIADLVIALSVGIIGFPRPIQLVPLEPSTELLSLFPLVIIPLFAVPLALFLHFCSLRALQSGRI